MDGVLYGITTAHTFLANLASDTDLLRSSPLNLAESDSCPSSEMEADRKTELREPHHVRKEAKLPNWAAGVEPLWNSMNEGQLPTVAFSLLETVSTFGSIVAHDSSSADWAIIPLFQSHVLPNLDGSTVLLDAVREVDLAAGDIWILCGAAIRCKGFLTQLRTSFHTKDAAIDCREVLLERCLPSGSSGAWIVRGDRVCGYVVAVTRSGLSCYMLSMVSTLDGIQRSLGNDRKVHFRAAVNDIISRQRTPVQTTSQLGGLTETPQLAQFFEIQMHTRQDQQQNIGTTEGNKIARLSPTSKHDISRLGIFDVPFRFEDEKGKMSDGFLQSRCAKAERPRSRQNTSTKPEAERALLRTRKQKNDRRRAKRSMNSILTILLGCCATKSPAALAP